MSSGTKNVAKDSELGQLHKLLAETYLVMLSDPERRKELKAADLMAIQKFLKDNDITCDVERSPALNRLREVAKNNVTQFPFDPAREA